MSNKKMFF